MWSQSECPSWGQGRPAVAAPRHLWGARSSPPRSSLIVPRVGLLSAAGAAGRTVQCPEGNARTSAQSELQGGRQRRGQSGGCPCSRAALWSALPNFRHPRRCQANIF